MRRPFFLAASAMVMLCVVAISTHAEPQSAVSRLERFRSALVFFTDFLLNRHSVDVGSNALKNSSINSRSAKNHLVRSAVPKVHGLQVIGAGFSRTGTKSIEAALSSHHAGLNHKIYDLRSILEHNHGERWTEAMVAWRNDNDLQPLRILVEELEDAGYTATLDFPVNLFAIPMSLLRPESRVLFSVRDTNEKWVQAWAHINKVMGNLTCRPWRWVIPDLTFTKHIVEAMYPDFEWRGAEYPRDIRRPLPWFEIIDTNPQLDSPEGQQEWIDLHDRFQEELEETVAGSATSVLSSAATPNNRLLIFNVKQGWGPWIPFLDLENCDLFNRNHNNSLDDGGLPPFPNINDRQSIQLVRQLLDLVAIGLPLWLGLMAWATIAIARWILDKVQRCKVKKL